MLVRTSAFYTPELLRANPNFLFVFGDNLQRRGKGGQAVIRDEPNAVGLATKRSPTTNPAAYFYENHLDFEILEEEIELILGLAQTNMVVIPFAKGQVQLGTGLSELPTRAPQLYAMLAHTFTSAMPQASLNRFHTNPVDMVCATCGSDDVLQDAWAEWSTDTQEWDLQTTFDNSYCNTCECECSLEEVPLNH